MAESIPSTAAPVCCSECGVAVAEKARNCWLCGRPVTVGGAAGVRRSNRLESFGPPLQFQLHSLFLATSLLAGCLALARFWPRPAMLVIVLAAAAYIRTAQFALVAARELRPLGALAKLRLFLQSLVVTLLLLASGAAVMTLFVSLGAVGIVVGQWCERPIVGFLGLCIGAVVGLYAALLMIGWLAARLWPVSQPDLQAVPSAVSQPDRVVSE